MIAVPNRVEVLVEGVRMALENMDKQFCTLSQIDYARIRPRRALADRLLEAKYLERPFAYEFYHQFRTLIDNGKVRLGDRVVQAEGKFHLGSGLETNT
ncbi:hypothetical protein AMJ40_02725 [candidate division TA06 bacterium DG_26]|uniref:Uncharacterized protein n=1 Tax=candidate division TA06 bacterium DG_26 TaxID=1703771 RepID=A0A0S7WK74_UNCT6|nr:MAG: hypothetical protein AMJ40_02725 [candidate division TA06 bacterium DG_26]